MGCHSQWKHYALVLAVRTASATLDSGTLQALIRRPGATRVSANGGRLLTQEADDRVGRVWTRDERTVPIAALTLP